MNQQKNNGHPHDAGFAVLFHDRLGRLLLLTAFLLLTLVLLFPRQAMAYTVVTREEPVTNDYEVAPSKFDLTMNPGGTLSRDVVIVNRTGQPLVLRFDTEDFEGSSDPSRPMVFLGDEDGERGARRWIVPEIDGIVLQQGETLTMRVRISAPASVLPGGYYASLVVSARSEGAAAGELPAGGEETAQAQDQAFTARRDCLFLVRIAGPVIADASLDPLEVPSLSEFGPIQIGLVFRNTGDVDLKASGRVTVTNMFGQNVAEITVPDWVVLPQSARRAVVTWDKGFGIGRYTVTAQIIYGDEPVQLASSTSFWIIPWRIILMIAAVVLVLASLLIIRARRRRAPAADREEAEIYPPAKREAAEAGAGPEAGAGEPPHVPGQIEEGPPQPPPEPRYVNRVSLSELFPSMDDARMIDLGDRETSRIVRELIFSQVELARSLVLQGETDKAKRELIEARSAALRIGLLSELGVIDDMLDGLSQAP